MTWCSLLVVTVTCIALVPPVADPPESSEGPAAVASTSARRERAHLYYGSSGTYLPVKELFNHGHRSRSTEASACIPGTDPPRRRPAISLEIGDGEFLVLVGPSGCGKSTTLRMLAGLEEVNDGDIFIGDRDVTDVPPKDRDIAMVFQNYALYPHMTVAENMGFALKIAGVRKDERRAARARGGQAPRPGARTWAASRRRSPAVSASASPWAARSCASPRCSAWTSRCRTSTPSCACRPAPQIASLQRRLGVTTVYVTHDQVEAMTMGDRIAVLKDGVLQQVGTPRDLYDKPANVFVAGFIGSPPMNLMQAKTADEGVRPRSAATGCRSTRRPRARWRNVTVGVRPEAWRVVANSEAGLPVQVTVVEDLGADAFVYGHSDVEGTPSNIIIRVSGRDHPQKGETMYVTTDPKNVHVFDTDTGDRLSD